MELIHKIWLLLFFGDTNPWWQLLSFQWVTFLTRPWDAKFMSMFLLGGAWLIFWMVTVRVTFLAAYYIGRAIIHSMWAYLSFIATIALLPISLALLIIGILPIIGRPAKAIRSFLHSLVRGNNKRFWQANDNFEEECRTTDDVLMNNPAAMAYFMQTMSKSSKK